MTVAEERDKRLAAKEAAAGNAGNTGEENMSQSEDLFQGKNVNMALNEIAMMHNCVPEWSLLSETGPPHQKMFTWQLKMGEHTTLGTGQNKKMAKNTAAEQMMSVLPDAWKQQAVNRMKRK